MEKGFEKADSANLPDVTMEMVLEFLISNADHYSAEIKNFRVKRSAKEEYGDNAVSYVQLKRDGQQCTVQCRITPEHKVHNKAYTVVSVIDEEQGKVLGCECKDCVASLGGCKHAVAFLFWLHRRSEKPRTTSKECHWRASNLLKVGKQDAYMTVKRIAEKDRSSLGPRNENLVETFLNATGKQDGGIFNLYFESPLNSFDLFYIILHYQQITVNSDAEDFILFLRDHFVNLDVSLVEKATVMESKCEEWFKIRYGRITASILYEAAKCKTPGGYLLEKIMGASKPVDTDPISWGKRLEPQVIRCVEKLKKIKISKSGIILHRDYPIFGASPDGVSTNFVIEVKCPSKQTTIENYVKDNKINNKYYFQLQLNMLFLNIRKGLFCVASPTFEEDNQVTIHEITLNEEKVKEMIELATIYWKHSIFNELIKCKS